MTVIYLGYQSSSYEADEGVTVNVNCDTNYTCSKLFKICKHTLTPPKNGNIFVFKGSNGSGDYVTLRNSSAKLKHVEVYFNKYENKTPLLFVLHFQNGDGRTASSLNKYYRMSSYYTDKASCKTKKIEDLCKYTSESHILCDLIKENDALKEFLMYDIMQRPDNGDAGNGKCTYNCNKIEVTDATKNGPPQLGPEFKVYKHQPSKRYTGKPACIIYQCQTLMGAGGRGVQELAGIQGKQYKHFCVFFGFRAKLKGTGACTGTGPTTSHGQTCTSSDKASCTATTTVSEGSNCTQDVPLLLELHKNTTSNGEPDYYVHRRKKNGEKNGDNDQYCWVKLTLPNDRDNGNELSQLLTDIGLSEQPKAGNGKLKDKLAQKPNGNGQTTYLDLLLKRLEFDLTDSVVILMDHPKSVSSGSTGDYGDAEIRQAIKTLEPEGKNGNINRLKLNGKKITLSNANSGQTKCLTEHKYRVVAHDFKQAVTGLGAKCHAGLRFLVPTKEKGDTGNTTQYAQLRLYSSDTQTEAKDLLYIYYTKSAGANGAHTQNESKVYVVFYQGTTNTGSSNQGDPRPLLLCYGGETYKPKNKDEYFSKWVKDSTVSKCLCQNGGAGNTDEKNKELLKAVTGVVGFLNQVDLSKHPGGTSTGTGDQTCTTGITSGVSGATTCQTTSTGTGNSCTYTVHTFQGSKIQVKVECSQVNGSKTCYKKLTHTPAGMSGATSAPNANFRLGDVEYCSNTGSRATRTGRIKYYGNGATGNGNLADTKNRWAPLTSVSAYFYDQDKGYCDPLLVVLEFAKNGVGVTATEKECYKLTKSDSGSLKWEKYDEVKSLVGQPDNGKLVAHLDAIRYCLKKVVKIELQRNVTNGSSYKLMGREATSPSGSPFNTPINGTGGQVKVCQLLPCPVLTGSNYKCFKHGLTEALKDLHHQVAGLAFTLPGERGSVIEIPLEQSGSQDVNCPNGPGPGAKITYNQCMGDIYVYFYGKGGENGSTSENQTDTVPLMLRYNKQFYKPESRDSYFDKWECVTELCKKAGTCKCPCCCGTNADGGGADCSADCDCCSTLVTQLNEVNRALNQIDLYPDKASGHGYGLPENGQGGIQVDTGTFPTERVKVVTQKGPKPPGTHVYERVVHRTKNGFQIGEITYSGKDITSGIIPNGAGAGSGTITIANGGTGHKNLVSVNSWNTVVVYYSTTDKDKKLPQLIVILKTDKAVNNSEPVTVSGGKYGYYVLATQNGVSSGVSGGGTGYEYKWFEVKDPPKTAVQLDEATDFRLLNAGVILLERTSTGGGSAEYGEDEISKAIESAIKEKQELASPGNSGQINRLKGKRITVTEETTTHTCIKDTGFKVMEHDLDELVNLSGTLEAKLTEVKLITGLKLLIPTSEKGKYKQVTLKENGAGNIKYHQSTKDKVYVFFYGDDPRPLLLCYGEHVYRATSKDYYDKQQWVKDVTVEKCDCNGQNEELMKALITTVGFLNRVELQQHPGTTGGGTCQNNGAGGQAATTANTCTYEVHKFHGSKIQVKVECCPVNGTTAKSCYKKLTHTPIGINGATSAGGDGFRLGDIVHTSDNCKIDYYGAANGNLTATNKYNPLVKVTAYFYDQDTGYNDPLLVILEFAKNGVVVTQNDKECYKLKGNSGSKLEWEKDTGACRKGGAELVQYLDQIRLSLTKTIRIRLEYNGTNHKTSYKLEGRDGTQSTGHFTTINGKTQVEVKVEVCSGCDELTKRNYKCLVHKLTSLGAGGLHVIGAVAFTLPGQNGDTDSDDKAIEIPLHKDASPPSPPSQEGPCPTGPEAGTKIEPLPYNSCMGDINVYFYDGTSSGVQPTGTDTVPLMLRYNGDFYCPCSRDEYFDKWVCVKALEKVGECGCAIGGAGDCSQLANQLDRVNLALNLIELWPFKSTDYGLPSESRGTQVLKDMFTTVRIKVVTQNRPSTGTGNGAHVYQRVVHRTKNGFLIGDIMYNRKEIAKNGITPNGQDTTIRIANGGTGHKNLVSVNSWNTVVVYYSTTDDKKQLPQLIVILKTDKAVNNSEPVTVSGGKYGYYVLATQNGVSSGVSGGGTGYEYKWFEVSGKEASGVELNDETDFTLINSAVILLEQQGGKCISLTYGEEKIGLAFRSAIQQGTMVKSPGREDGQINRIKGKTITVKNETQETGDYTCLSGTGFRVMTHDIKTLVELGPLLQGKLGTLTLITGLKFLIPTPDGGGKYNQLTLKDNGLGTGSGIIKYHKKEQNKIYVFFYGSDPRPLLVCYDNWAYAATSMKDYDDQKWTKDKEAAECKCTDPPSENCKLLKVLVRVSDFLNPVDIEVAPTSKTNPMKYYVHWFNGLPISVLVEAQKTTDKFCYHKYTHTHIGVGCNGTGFRLGNIYHCDINCQKNCIKENGTKTPPNGKCISASDVDDTKTYKPSPEVVVFYYKKDSKHDHPLLVALKGPVWCSFHGPYFELQKKVDPGQPKLYTRGKNGLDLRDTKPDSELAKKLDDILYRISKKLQVILGRRPVARPYSPGDVKNYSHHAGVDEQLKKRREQKDHELNRVAQNAVDSAAKAAQARGTTLNPPNPEAIRSSLTHHVLRETSYEAQLYEKDGSEPASTPPTHTAITVREIDCHKSYSDAGYRCFRHLLVNTQGIEDVGGLKLAVFDGQGGQDLQLCKGNGTAGKNGKIDQITYTVCKGDLYVFFYGEDPRPLMLCYNSEAYRPTSMAGYCTKWVRVNDSGSMGKGVNCLCPPDKVGQKYKFNAAPLLEALYRVSVALNPVYLCLTEEAYQKLDPKHGQQQQEPAAQSGQSEGAKPAKQEWSYTIHKESQPPVCVRVTGVDLRCYKEYVHQPEKQGFRLGAVTYASAEEGGAAGSAGQQCSQGTAGQTGPAGNTGGACSAPSTPASTPYCFAYDYTKQLLTVSTYYYMYDSGHNWPLVVELGFKGQSSEFYRLCCAGDNGAKPANGECKASSGLKWVKMAGEGGNGSTQNGHSNSTGDQCQPCNTGADNANNGGETPEDSKKMCAGDAEFVKRAQDIHNAIHSAHSPASVFKAHERDLEELIERRAYEIRNQLKIDYGEKTKERLILETASNCWEDSIVAYVVGGGVLGVAGGGGWKIAVAVLGLVVKL